MRQAFAFELLVMVRNGMSIEEVALATGIPAPRVEIRVRTAALLEAQSVNAPCTLASEQSNQTRIVGLPDNSALSTLCRSRLIECCLPESPGYGVVGASPSCQW
jgi:hypothetical protein